VTYYERRVVSGPFDEVVDEVREQLEHEGFGVISDIDLRAAFEEQQQELPGEGRCRVIDTCNPSVAHAETNDGIARRVLLPAKIVVYENEAGETVVAITDSGAVLSGDDDREYDDPELEDLAETVDQRLAQVLRSVTMERDVMRTKGT
jgi:uncharacterized protein (DUF302 family)